MEGTCRHHLLQLCSQKQAFAILQQTLEIQARQSHLHTQQNHGAGSWNTSSGNLANAHVHKAVTDGQQDPDGDKSCLSSVVAFCEGIAALMGKGRT